MTPLATEIEAMVKSGLAHVWDSMPHVTKLLIRAWFFSQSIMQTWEQDQSEKG